MHKKLLVCIVSAMLLPSWWATGLTYAQNNSADEECAACYTTAPVLSDYLQFAQKVLGSFDTTYPETSFNERPSTP
jgi:hypothetical protein